MSSFSVKELIEWYEDFKQGCIETLNICKEAVEKSLSPHEVWLKQKERMEKAIKRTEKRLDRLRRIKG